MFRLIAGIAAATAIVGHAEAKDAAAGFSRICEEQALAGGYTARAAYGECACGAGVIGGQVDERQWYILGRALPVIQDQEALTDEIEKLNSEGYSPGEVNVIGQVLISAASVIDRVCTYYRTGGSTMTQVSFEPGDAWPEIATELPNADVASIFERAGRRLSHNPSTVENSGAED